VEGRLNKPPLNTLQVHDTLRLFDRKDEKRFIDVEVLEVKIYQSFRQMLEEEGIEHCLPSVSSIDDGCAIYHQFPGYEQGAKTMGVLAIRITLLPQK
jgi:ASC-1-like (ASCH) protein